MLQPPSGKGKGSKNGSAPEHLQHFLSLLKNVKPTANGWDACCPSHDDTHPSLGVALGDEDRILVHCRSRDCSAEQITAALGLTVASLFAPPPNGKPNKPRGKIVAAYPYTDEAGALLFQTVRYEPKGFKQRRPDGKERWVWNLKGVRRVLYRLPGLVQADPGQPVFVVEGEKDAHNLTVLGLVATTNPQGAGKWRPEYSEALRGRHVVILPDNDEPGRKHAQQVARSLQGVAASVRIVALPGLPEKGDVSDWLQMAGSGKELLLELVSTAPPEQANGQPKPEAGGQDAPDADSGKPTQAEALLHSAADAVPFHAPDGTAYATVPVGDGDAANGPRATLAIRSGDFKSWLHRRHYRATGSPVRAQAILDTVALYEARARFDGQCLPVYCRVGEGAGGTIWLDLGSPGWEAVEITPDGWQIVERPAVKFRRSRSLLALPQPIPGGTVEELRPFVNVRPQDWPLLVAWLVAALRPRGPYPLLCLHGEQGSAKSTTARALRALVDPNAAPLRSEPRDAGELMLMATHSWVVALDNLSYLSTWLSDTLCQLSTGGGLSKRQLYTDSDEIVFNAQGPVILTGIEELATRSDLLSRALILHLPAIAEDKCRTEADLRIDFEKARPRILGALLDVVAGALQQLPSVQLPRPPRMADFATWATAAEPALGWKPGTFLAAYAGNRQATDELALEASPLYPPLCALAERGDWEGTPTELLAQLTVLAGETVARSRCWPKRAHILSGRLDRLAPNLRRVGIQIHSWRDKRHRKVRITRAATPGEPASPASSASSASPPQGFPGGAGDAPMPGDAARVPDDAPIDAEQDAGNPGNDAGDAGDTPSHSSTADDDKEFM